MMYLIDDSAHYIDDPLLVINCDLDFSNLGMLPCNTSLNKPVE